MLKPEGGLGGEDGISSAPCLDAAHTGTSGDHHELPSSHRYPAVPGHFIRKPVLHEQANRQGDKYTTPCPSFPFVSVSPKAELGSA